MVLNCRGGYTPEGSVRGLIKTIRLLVMKKRFNEKIAFIAWSVFLLSILFAYNESSNSRHCPGCFGFGTFELLMGVIIELLMEVIITLAFLGQLICAVIGFSVSLGRGEKRGILSYLALLLCNLAFIVTFAIS